MSSSNEEHCYLFHAYANLLPISLSEVRNRFADAHVERREKNALEIIYDHEKRLYIFEYGALVFFNVSIQEQEGLLHSLSSEHSFFPAKKEAENFSEDDYILRLGAEKASIHFNEVRLPTWDSELVYLVAQVLSKSAALDVVEQSVREHLHTSEHMTSSIKSFSWIRTRRSQVLRFIAAGLSVRHRILNQLTLLDKPADTWEHQELYSFHRDLVENFELNTRLATVEKELGLTGEVSALLLETLNTKRSEFLEIIIIVLIGIEIAHTFLG